MNFSLLGEEFTHLDPRRNLLSTASGGTLITLSEVCLFGAGYQEVPLFISLAARQKHDTALRLLLLNQASELWLSN